MNEAIDHLCTHDVDGRLILDEHRLSRGFAGTSRR
jgi:hypothetical protein